MINWSLPSESKLRGSHLIGTSLPNFINILMNKTSANNLFYDLNACNKYFVEEADLRNIETYCLIISGKYDIMTPAKSGYKLRTLLKNSNIEVLDDCGHFHIQEKSSEVRKIISKYIEK